MTTQKHEHIPNISLEPSSPGKMLYDAHLKLSAGLVERLAAEGYDISINAWAILNLLWEKDERPQFEISEHISRDRHQTSRLIDSLDRQGLATRVASTEDKRIKLVGLTEEGKQARVALRSASRDYLETIFRGLSQDDYDCFLRCLTHITTSTSDREEI